MSIKGLILILVSSLLYAGLVIVNKLALKPSIDTFQYALFMAVFLAVPSLLFLSPRRELLKMSWYDWGLCGIIGVLASGVVQLLWIYGQKLTTSVNAGFITTLATPLTAIFAYLILRERLSSHKLLMAMIAFLGMGIMITNLRLGGLNNGDLLLISAMVVIGFTNVLAKIAMNRLSGLTVSLLRIVFGAAFMLIVALATKQFFSFKAVEPVFGYLLLSSFFTFTFLIAYYIGMQLTSPTYATVIFLLEVVFTSIVGVLLLGEMLSWLQWVTGGIASLAIILFVLAD
ncbi:hypothetical protein DRJ48_04015 [Candidatus Woesearchaeota archaeon]|nr:DMT family transporter [Candidatus Woesearchaeota archaeon]RLE42199.1 MAG: hypothetical protein DRJ48_04015 [Candidatus Woesearchaeota archaeon]